MSFSFGRNLVMHVFGESHGALVGVIVEGFPTGLRIDEGRIQAELDKRRPGTSAMVTQRKETDQLKILSGNINGISTGAPITMIIENKDVDSSSYVDFKRRPRPGHADFPATVKYGGHSDIRGSGVFSGRMTAALVMAGALVRGYLDDRGISVEARLTQIGGYAIEGRLPESIISKAKEDGDSLGSLAACTIEGMPVGIGEPMFESIESVIAHAMYSIPAVKGVSFGAGFECAKMRGSEFNDQYRMEGGKIVTTSNNNGGILGGLSNGMPIVFHVAIKPTPSISRPQMTVDLDSGKECEMTINGRHDPCIGIRAIPVIENLTAFCMADLLLR
ncbi:MAG: chorismate synthase [Candidatus Methanofastidiosa archaeon]|nr:chorismate synthase [Candidatus Methanofastidiosa archaeon]